jgi:hypothetical protein
MAYNNNNYGTGSAGIGSNYNTSGGANKDSPVEAEELSAEDYAIIAAGFGALGEIFAFLSLVKAKQVTKDTGGQVGLEVDPVLFVQSRKKAAKRRSRPPR